jgi:hypothetical protein
MSVIPNLTQDKILLKMEIRNSHLKIHLKKVTPMKKREEVLKGFPLLSKQMKSGRFINLLNTELRKIKRIIKFRINSTVKILMSCWLGEC